MLHFVAILLLAAFQGRPDPSPPDYCATPALAAPALPARIIEGMGQVEFAITTGSDAARAFFNQGMAQLYGFWFAEAERSFLQAAKLDPSAAMPQWGIAMAAAGDFVPSYQLPSNRSMRGRTPAPNSPLARAHAAANAALRLKANASPREQMYVEAVAARRRLDAADPVSDYIWRMKQLVAAFPDDAEARVMLALALQWGYHPLTREPATGTLEAIDLLRKVLAVNPHHPGGHHFLIHGLEGGRNPHEAWGSCERYPELAPNIPHALHMPGHIYVQTGRFADTARAFEAAAAKELTYMAGDALYGDGHYLHNQDFLIYTLGVQGRLGEARKRIADLMAIKENPRQREVIAGYSAYRVGWLSLVRTLVRFERWNEILDTKILPLYNKPIQKSWFNWARGLAYLSVGNAAAARESRLAMRGSLDEIRRALGGVPPALQIAIAELDGFLELRTSNAARGLQMLLETAELQQTLPYAEPPSYPRPVLELAARSALAMGNLEAAQRAYRRLLAAEPASGRALWGLALTLELSGQAGEAKRYRQEFEAAWAAADVTLVP